MDLDKAPLPIERFKVVRQCHEVGLRRQPIGWVPPIGVGEDAELSAFHERLHPIAYVREIFRTRERPVRDRLCELGGLRRIARERAHHVDPVERLQVIEVNHVIMDILCGHDEVAQNACIRRWHGSDGMFHRANGRDRMHRRTHPADSLGERPCIARIASFENQLDTTKHRRGRPCLRNGAPVDLRFDTQMTFDARDGIDDDVGHFRFSS